MAGRYILGLSSYAHEATAALIRDGEIRAVAEEERFNRKRHTWEFPQNGIAYCLESEGITLADVAAVTFFWKPLRELYGNALHVARYLPASLRLLSAPSGGEGPTLFGRLGSMLRLGHTLRQRFGAAPPVHFVEHHLCHAASSFYASGFDESAVLSLDGRGESTTTLLALGRGTSLTKLREIAVPHSVGHLYAAITSHLGFRPFHDEWKVMGMAGYGLDSAATSVDDLAELLPDGGFRLNLDYFSFHTRGSAVWVSPRFAERFGPATPPGGPYDQRHFDLALATQRLVSRLGVHLANHLYEKTHVPRLCLSGGVALNCLMNRDIIEKTPFREFFFQPMANDAGAALGSALYWEHQVLGGARTAALEDVYLGPKFSDAECQRALEARGIRFRRHEDICAATAAELAAGKIVGWFQGRMEAGPRALGNRSLLAHPGRVEVRDRLNRTIKRRELFRPFAPSVKAERAPDYFAIPKHQESPFMNIAAEVLPAVRSQLAAVVHVDGTARVHTVRRASSPRYWQLLDSFEKLTGLPVLLNTSFNENEPIVCTPAEAVDCFMRTGFDVLVLGDLMAVTSG